MERHCGNVHTKNKDLDADIIFTRVKDARQQFTNDFLDFQRNDALYWVVELGSGVIHHNWPATMTSVHQYNGYQAGVMPNCCKDLEVAVVVTFNRGGA